MSKRWLVWSNFDPNDSFEVEGDTVEDAALDALNQLDWAISAKPIQDESERSLTQCERCGLPDRWPLCADCQ